MFLTKVQLITIENNGSTLLQPNNVHSYEDCTCHKQLVALCHLCNSRQMSYTNNIQQIQLQKITLSNYFQVK